MPVVKEDDAMPVVKEDDAVPVVNQDEAPVDPFGDRDDWVVVIMSKVFWKIKSVVENTDVLEELPAYLNKNRADNMEYILACYQSRIDGFDTSIATQGISTTHNTEKH
jgi:hypothetical protein